MPDDNDRTRRTRAGAVRFLDATAIPPTAFLPTATNRRNMVRKTKAPRGNALVIVESPAKARTISKFLGPGYTIEASIGHVRDLPRGPRRYPPNSRGRLGLPGRERQQGL